MGDDASRPSLNAQSGELSEFVAELAARVGELEREGRIGELLGAAGQSLPPPPPRARHRRPGRERPANWRVINGGLAALAPLALPGHSPALPAAAAVGRGVWLSRRAQVVVTVLALGMGAVGATPATAADGPDRDAPVACAHLYQCVSGEGSAGHLLRHHHWRLP